MLGFIHSLFSMARFTAHPLRGKRFREEAIVVKIISGHFSILLGLNETLACLVMSVTGESVDRM